MIYIIFSDVHGNAEALKMLLKTEEPSIDKQFIFCGDICGYYYETRQCIDLLKGIKGLVAVRGNHDQYYIDAFDNREMTEKLVEKYGSSYRKKREDVREYLLSLPLMRTINCGGRIMQIQHGTPENPLEGRMYPNSSFPAANEGIIYLVGHTHYRMYRDSGENIWVNPGSLGQPRDGNGFSYCKLDTKTWNFRFCSIDVDIRKLVQEIRINDPENKYLEEILCRKK